MSAPFETNGNSRFTWPGTVSAKKGSSGGYGRMAGERTKPGGGPPRSKILLQLTRLVTRNMPSGT